MLGTDPRYVALAGAAATRIGASGGTVLAGILAQWQCEQPANAWPPVHNNPGFLTIGALRSNGISAGAYATSAPGVNFLAQFGSPLEGAQAYGDYIARSPLYGAARARAAAGDGLGMALAICAAGYGTRASCVSSAYGLIAGRTPPPDATALASSSSAAPAIIGVVQAVYGSAVSLAGAPCQGVAPVPIQGQGPFGIIAGNGGVAPIPKERALDPCACPAGWVRAQFDPQLSGLFGTNYVPLDQLPPGGANACVPAGTRPGPLYAPGQPDSPIPSTDQLAAAIAGIPAALGGVLGGVAVLALLLALVGGGLYIVLTAQR